MPFLKCVICRRNRIRYSCPLRARPVFDCGNLAAVITASQAASTQRTPQHNRAFALEAKADPHLYLPSRSTSHMKGRIRG